jgi:hypothetical protein
MPTGKEETAELIMNPVNDEERPLLIVTHPEELVYRSCYAPVSLQDLLTTAEKRSKIRRLPPPQLFFSIKELDDEQMTALIPHLTEAQWEAILDLDTWNKDEVDIAGFLSWQRHILEAEDAVARKILRATDPEMWALAFCRDLRIASRTEEDEFEWEPAEDDSTFVTQDARYLVVLPREAERARLYVRLLSRLSQLDTDYLVMLLEESRYRTATELEEEVYQSRRRRIEDLGFQDYFEAISLYTPLDLSDSWPEKDWEPSEQVGELPAILPGDQDAPMLLFRAFAEVANTDEIQSLVEELTYVCNKLMSADRIAPGDPGRIRKTIRKAICGLNLGLDVWCKGELGRAVYGVRKLYLQSFLQFAFGCLVRLQRRARALLSHRDLEPAGPLEAFLEGLAAPYPTLREVREGQVVDVFLETRDDLSRAERILENIESENAGCQSKK